MLVGKAIFLLKWSLFRWELPFGGGPLRFSWYQYEPPQLPHSKKRRPKTSFTAPRKSYPSNLSDIHPLMGFLVVLVLHFRWHPGPCFQNKQTPLKTTGWNRKKYPLFPRAKHPEKTQQFWVPAVRFRECFTKFRTLSIWTTSWSPVPTWPWTKSMKGFEVNGS